MRKAILTVAACATLLWVSTARAASDHEKCMAGRAKAKGKYDLCVAKWLVKEYTGIFDQEKISKCRIKYAAAWTKLQGLTGSVVCNQARFIDNGITVTDNLTGLVWEKKTTVVGSGTDFAGDRHDVDNSYTWTTSDGDTSDEDGTIFTDFLANLNAGGGFAGANGWRLPTFAELQTIILPEPTTCQAFPPCIDSVFGPTQTYFYWSASTTAGNSQDAWYANFAEGGVSDNAKSTGSIYARAVRGGL